jgi:zinc protease
LFVKGTKVPLVTILLGFKAGAVTERVDTNGLTHLWEHMFFKGNAKWPTQEAFTTRVRELGIDFNGDTGAEHVRYFFTMPSALLGEGLEFMAEAIQRPLFEPKELERERLVVLDEYERDQSQPSFDFERVNQGLIFGDLAFTRDPLGRRVNIARASREELLAMKEKLFIPPNAVLVVGGDVDEAKTMALVNKFFGAWRAPEDWKDPVRPAYPELKKTTTFVMTRELVENAQVVITLPGPSIVDQPVDTYRADLLVGMLSHPSGRFYKKFVDSGMTFSAGVSYLTERYHGRVVLWAECAPKDALRVREALLAEVSEWMDPAYFTPRLREDVQRNLVIDRQRQVDQISSFSRGLGLSWIVTGLDYEDSYIKRMSAMKEADARAFVKAYLLGRPYVGGILLSPEGAKEAGLKDDSGVLVKTYAEVYHAR